MTVVLAEHTWSPCESRDGVRVGAVIGESYRILGLLGRGGMGEVYEAEHLRLQSKVAVKVLRAPSDPSAVRQLLREARLTASLDTEHVVRVTDCGTLKDGSPYVVMEHLRGEDLRCLLARRPQLPVQQALRITLQICAGLSDLHGAKVVHRDLKPANVFVLDTKSGECRCKLLDLGIARTASGDTSRSVAVAGSVRYMAPEQLADRKNVAPHTDVYAAGVILYQCLTGSLPHQGETVEEIMFNILHGQAAHVTTLRPELSTALSQLTMRAIARDPGARPRSAAEFSRAIAAFLVPEQVSVARPGPLDTTAPELHPSQVAFGWFSSRTKSAAPSSAGRRRFGIFVAGILAASSLAAVLTWSVVGQRSVPSVALVPRAPLRVARSASDARADPEAHAARLASQSTVPALAPSAAAPLPVAFPSSEPRRSPSTRAPLRHSGALAKPASSNDAEWPLESNPYAP